MSASGVSVDPEKVEAVMSWERPKSVFEIRSFLGLAGVLQETLWNGGVQVGARGHDAGHLSLLV